MNVEESRTLLKKGRAAWNAWADEISSKRPVNGVDDGCWNEWLDQATVDFRSISFDVTADFSEFKFPGNVKLDKAIFRQTACFNRAVFEGEVSLDESRFIGRASFQKSNFKSDAIFDNTSFGDVVQFDEAKFEQGASFFNTSFEQYTSFYNAKFKKDVWFVESNFKSKTRFNNGNLQGNAWFNNVKFEQEVSFCNARFKQEASFYNARFEQDVSFIESSFTAVARFNDALFGGNVWFKEATFQRVSSFYQTTFSGVAWFSSARFNGDVSFATANFSRQVDFSGSTFGDSANFLETRFQGDVNFSAIQSRSKFTIDSAVFEWGVPDFVQANFTESPRLDHIENSQDLWHVSKKNDPNQEARWRALRRLALQSQDHIREQSFYGREIQARRGTTDRVLQASYWFGICYQIFSNFGQSITRPLCWWLSGIILSTVGYCHLHHYDATGRFWPIRCFEAPAEIWAAAFGLALHRGLPALSSLGNRLADYHSVLYNVGPKWGQASLSPSGEAFLGQAQVVFSTAMLFLFLLALRNRFRMK